METGKIYTMGGTELYIGDNLDEMFWKIIQTQTCGRNLVLCGIELNCVVREDNTDLIGKWCGKYIYLKDAPWFDAEAKRNEMQRYCERDKSVRNHENTIDPILEEVEELTPETVGPINFAQSDNVFDSNMYEAKLYYIHQDRLTYVKVNIYSSSVVFLDKSETEKLAKNYPYILESKETVFKL